MKRIKVSRYARSIKVSDPFTGETEEVYTRYSKREYEKRRDWFEDQDLYNPPAHLANYSYEEWTEWGSQGGRPQKWSSEAQRMQTKRAQRKLELGKPLSRAEQKLLGLVKSRPGAYRSELGRAMTAAERQRLRRQRIKGR